MFSLHSVKIVAQMLLSYYYNGVQITDLRNVALLEEKQEAWLLRNVFVPTCIIGKTNKTINI